MDTAMILLALANGEVSAENGPRLRCCSSWPVAREPPLDELGALEEKRAFARPGDEGVDLLGAGVGSVAELLVL